MLSLSKKTQLLIGVTVTQFVVPFMNSAVGLILPSIGNEFQTSALMLSFVALVYTATTTMLILPLGRYSDLRGHLPLYRLGIIILMIATLALGIAPNMATFIALRFLQGLGGAMIVASGMAILINAYPPKERGQAIGIVTMGVYAGLSAGPFLAGLLTSWLGWRFVFFAGGIPSLIALFCVLQISEEARECPQNSGSFDIWGALISASAIGLLLLGSAYFETLFGKLLIAGGLLLLVGFVLWEKRSASPLFDIALFSTNKSFSTGCLVQFINYASTFSLIFLMSLYLQSGRGISPYEAGLILVVQPIVQAVLSPFSGRLADRVPAHIVAAVGMSVCSVALGIAATFDATTSNTVIYTMLVCMGVGVALFSSPNSAVIMGSVQRSELGVASAMLGCMRTSGMTASMLITSLFLAQHMGAAAVTTENFSQYIEVMHMLLLLCTGLSIVGIYIAFKGVLKKN